MPPSVNYIHKIDASEDMYYTEVKLAGKANYLLYKVLMYQVIKS